MKEEKIGMYNIDEIYEVLTENVEGSFSNRSMVDAMYVDTWQHLLPLLEILSKGENK